MLVLLLVCKSETCHDIPSLLFYIKHTASVATASGGRKDGERGHWSDCFSTTDSIQLLTSSTDLWVKGMGTVCVIDCGHSKLQS